MSDLEMIESNDFLKFPVAKALSSINIFSVLYSLEVGSCSVFVSYLKLCQLN